VLDRLLGRRRRGRLDAQLVAELRRATEEIPYHGRYGGADFAADTEAGKALLAEEPEQLTTLVLDLLDGAAARRPPEPAHSPGGGRGR
jgi:hypothetical protein